MRGCKPFRNQALCNWLSGSCNWSLPLPAFEIYLAINECSHGNNMQDHRLPLLHPFPAPQRRAQKFPEKTARSPLKTYAITRQLIR